MRWAESLSHPRSADHELRVSEERFALAVLGAKDGVWDRDMTTDMVYLSPRAQEISMGRPSDGVDVRHEAEWRKWHQIHPEDAARREAAMRDHLKGRTLRWEGEWRVRHQDGSYHWVHARGICTRDASGRAVRLAGSTTDVDARKRTEDALRQSEERYARAMEGSSDGLWEWNPVTDEMFLSARARELFAVAEGAEIKTRADLRARAGFHPEDLQYIEEMIQASLAGAAPGFDIEYRTINQRGEVRWMRSRGKAFRDAQGQPTLMTGSLTDVTERKRTEQALRQSEERYALAVEAAGEGHSDWNLETGEFYVSPRLLEICGYTPGTAFKDRAEWVARFPFHPEDRPKWEQAVAVHWACQASRFHMEVRIVVRGETRWVRFVFLCSRDASGKPVRWTGSTTDVTDRKRAEEALRISEERYARAMEAAQDGHWDWNVDTGEYYTSPRDLQLYGLPADSTFASRADFLARLPLVPEDRDAWLRAVADLFAGTGSRLSMDMRAIVHGETRWIQFSGVCVRDASGKPLRWSGTSRDVTDRKRAEEALRISEERYARAMEGSDAGLWEWNPGTDAAFASPRAHRLFGIPDGVEIHSRADLKAHAGFHPEDRQRIEDAMQACLARRTEGFEAEFRVINPAGETRWVRSRGKVFPDAQGKPALLAGSVTDIDARKLAEQELKRSEERYALVMAAADEGYWDWIVASDQFHASPRLLEMYGLPPATTFAGREDFLARIPLHPEDRPKWQEAVAAHFAGETARFDKELRILRGGETRWLHLTGLATRTASGEVVRWAGATKDVTARKQAEQALRLSEERYALAMQASGAGYWDWKIATDEYYTSPRHLEIAGFPPGTRFSGRAEVVARVPFHPEDRPRYDAAVAAHFAGETPRLDIEMRLVRPGEVRWVHLIGMCLRDAAGVPVRWAGSVSDITQHKRAEEELKRLERQLRQAQRLEALGTLAGGIAHDFNNILAAMLGYGEMALRGAPKGSQLHRDLDNIMIAGERGRALIDRILAFSRSGVGERVAVHVEAVVREALELLSAKLPDNVRVETDLRAARAATLGDPIQMHQVFMNLATNAVQAMASAGVLRVSLETVRLDSPRLATTGQLPPGEFLVLEVIDSGAGIAPEILERIFDPFFTTKQPGVGTGLGLALVYGIVAELGGAIDVASTVGKGSAFTVYLPRAGDAAEERRGDQPQVPRGDGQRVLVVDDEELLLTLAIRTLEELGYAPVGFSSSAAALEAFRADPGSFDAIVTDERMPGLSGSELIREVRATQRAIPILLVGGYVGGQVTALALEAGADEVLKKPLLARDLAMSLARVLRSRRTSSCADGHISPPA